MDNVLQPSIFIIVLNYNGKATLANCLSSLYLSDYPNFEVLVVDNASTDGSLEEAKQLFPKASFIRNSSNIGFSRGNNIGIRYALEKFADYVFILNNDTLVETATLSNLAGATQQNSKAGMVSPLILAADNRHLWFAGGLIDWHKMRTRHSYKLVSDQPYATEYLSGCAMFVKKEVFKKIGLFDERFFLYYEDADFSVRARQAGFDLLVVPSAKMNHLEQSNEKNSAKTYWLVLSGLLFFHTHASAVQKVWLQAYLALRKTKNFYDLAFSKNKAALDVRRAYQDFKKLS